MELYTVWKRQLWGNFLLTKGNVTSMVPAMPSEPQLCAMHPTVIIKVVLWQLKLNQWTSKTVTLKPMIVGWECNTLTQSLSQDLKFPTITIIKVSYIEWKGGGRGEMELTNQEANAQMWWHIHALAGLLIETGNAPYCAFKEILCANSKFGQFWVHTNKTWGVGGRKPRSLSILD